MAPRSRALAQTVQFALACAAIASIVYAAVGSSIDGQFTQLILERVVARAGDQVALEPTALRQTIQAVWIILGVGFGLLVLAMVAAAHVIFGDPRPPDSQDATNGALIPDPGPRLTCRELEVLRLMATARSYAEIAAELVIGEETVRTHAKRILHKFHQPDRAHAVAAAAHAGLLSAWSTQGDTRRSPSGEAEVTPALTTNHP